MLEEIEKSRLKAIQLGIPEQHFNSDLCRKHLDERNGIMLAAIVSYLDELAGDRPQPLDSPQEALVANKEGEGSSQAGPSKEPNEQAG